MRKPQGVLRYDANREILVFGEQCLLVQKIEGAAYLNEYDIGAHGRRRGDKCIREISEGEKDNFELLGEAEGISFSHCLFLGWKHTDKFFEQVVAFHESSPRHSFAKVRFDFFAAKPF